jgi:hypothetical protein
MVITFASGATHSESPGRPSSAPRHPNAYDRGVTSEPTNADATTATTVAGPADTAAAVGTLTLERPGPEPAGSSPAVQIPAIVRRRLAPEQPTDRLVANVGTAVVVLLALVLRLIGLGHPKGKIFDEIYYATEGDDLIHHGVEWNHTTHTGDFVVHPPLGKWLIGLGEYLSRELKHLTGWNFLTLEFGWRIMPAIFGTLAIWLLIRVTRRMFRSTVLGIAAGLLMSVDGMEFVLSRTALLDIFLMFFVLAAFCCLVMDRDSRRLRWLRALEAGLDPTERGRAGRPATPTMASIPWWRLAAGVMLGCAMAVKWSALWYILLFTVLIVIWEAGTRRSAGDARHGSSAPHEDGRADQRHRPLRRQPVRPLQR